MGNSDIAKYGEATQFTSDNQPDNKQGGRKKNFLNYLKEDYEVSQDDLTNFINHISCLSVNEVERIADLIKSKDESVKDMPFLYAKLFELFGKAKTADIVQIMRMADKAIERKNLKIEDTTNYDKKMEWLETVRKRALELNSKSVENTNK
jgi:hypothetical protein